MRVGDVQRIELHDGEFFTSRSCSAWTREASSKAASADPATLAGSHEFAKRRDQLQKKMAGVISRSRTRFDEPWGLVSLFQAAGSTGASARVVATGLLLERP